MINGSSPDQDQGVPDFSRRTCFICRVKPVNIPEPGKSLVSNIFKPPGGQKVARIARKISSGQMKSNMAENGATAQIPANPAYFSLVSETLTGSICHVIKVNRVIARLSETSAPIDLPTIVWVNILDYLDLNNRYHVSVTCSRLNEAFNHPTLWRKMKLFVLGNNENYGFYNQVVIPTKSINLVKHFGKYFQHLTFVISGHLDQDFGNWNDLVEEVSKECRLETLTLYAGVLTSIRHFAGNRSCSRNLKPLVNIVKNAFRLKNLNIVSWPMFPRNLENLDENIFEAAMLNPKLKDLEHMSLFWSNTNVWTERQPILLSPRETADFVGHFSNLKHLALRSPMMNEQLLEVLSSKQRQTLKRLQILVNYIPEDPDFAIPEISDRVWERFCLKNVGVEVELTVMSRVPLVEFSNLLKPSCPVSVTKFMAYSRCDENVVQYVTDKYKNTLKCFESFGEDTAFENDLVSMVEKSPNLLQLIYRGRISCENVERLAALRSNSWMTFDFLRENIYVNNTEDQYDEDQVIARGPDGKYVLVAMLRFHQREQMERENDVRKQEMIKTVSKSVGYKWIPTPKKIQQVAQN